MWSSVWVSPGFYDLGGASTYQPQLGVGVGGVAHQRQSVDELGQVLFLIEPADEQHAETVGGVARTWYPRSAAANDRANNTALTPSGCCRRTHRYGKVKVE